MPLNHIQVRDNSLLDVFLRVRAPAVQQACLSLIVNSAQLRGFHTKSSGEGEKKHFGYWRDDQNWFAFIANNEWLLFYFRHPFLERVNLAVEEVRVAFPNAEVNPKGEMTVKIRDLCDSNAVQTFIGRFSF